MSKEVRQLPLWPAKQPLPAGAISLFYDPNTDQEYQLDPARFGSERQYQADEVAPGSPAGTALTIFQWLLQQLGNGTPPGPPVITPGTTVPTPVITVLATTAY